MRKEQKQQSRLIVGMITCLGVLSIIIALTRGIVEGIILLLVGSIVVIFLKIKSMEDENQTMVEDMKRKKEEQLRREEQFKRAKEMRDERLRQIEEQRRKEEYERERDEIEARKGNLLERAEEEWEQEKHSEKGSESYRRIVANWQTYVDTYSKLNKLTKVGLCELGVISCMMEEDASIKKQNEILSNPLFKGMPEYAVLSAIDQLLIKRIIIIAMEGAFDYFRINLGWNIVRDIEAMEREMEKRKIAKEKEIQMVMEKWEPSNTKLQEVTVVPMDKEELTKRLEGFTDKMKQDIIACLSESEEPISLFKIGTYGTELSQINQLKLEEIVRTLVEEGCVERIEDKFGYKYRIAKK